ncbi:MAG TPA: hypothetical protein VII99_16105, partial [Bacteroidia bacterium]
MFFLGSYLNVYGQPCGPVTISATSTTLCAGVESTTLTANTSGGVLPYTYQWSTGATTQITTGGAGQYTVSI